MDYHYGFQQEQEILVSWFFEFLVSWQEMGDKKQEIDFLHFLLILTKLWAFLMIFKVQ